MNKSELIFRLFKYIIYALLAYNAFLFFGEDVAAWLAIVDIVNASTWLIIVILLEIEVFLQLRDRLTNRMMSTLKYAKTFFYGVLFVCAAYWGFKGSFLDFWNAFLWLLAFIFIELNVFQWQAGTKEEREHAFKV